MRRYFQLVVLVYMMLNLQYSAMATQIEEFSLQLRQFNGAFNFDDLPKISLALLKFSDEELQGVDKAVREECARIVYDNTVPDSFTPIEDIHIALLRDAYRAAILIMSILKPALSADVALEDLHITISPRDALSNLCSVYYRYGEMDTQMDKAFNALESHYNIKISRKALTESLIGSTLGGPIDGAVHVTHKGCQMILAKPLYRNTALCVAAVAFVYKYYY